MAEETLADVEQVHRHSNSPVSSVPTRLLPEGVPWGPCLQGSGRISPGAAWRVPHFGADPSASVRVAGRTLGLRAASFLVEVPGLQASCHHGSQRMAFDRLRPWGPPQSFSRNPGPVYARLHAFWA